MDIDLLSKMVKELILGKDEVNLPGVGCFVAEMEPASFSDKGYTINPPYRKLSFRKKSDSAESSLAELYARSNNLSMRDSEIILTSFLAEMKTVLQEKKVIVFPGLGKLRATRENNFFFVPDEKIDIYPDGFGLESISLKSHQETAESFSAAVEGIKDMLDGTVLAESAAGALDAKDVYEGSPEDGKSGEDGAGNKAAGALDAKDGDGGSPEDGKSGEDGAGNKAAGTDDAKDVDEGSPEDGKSGEDGAGNKAAGALDAKDGDGGSPEDGKSGEDGAGNKAAGALDAKDGDGGSPEDGKSGEDGAGNKAAGALDAKDSAAEASEKKTAAKRKKTWLIVLATCFGLFFMLLLTYLLLSNLATDFIDSLLYSEEELEILRLMK